MAFCREIIVLQYPVLIINIFNVFPANKKICYIKIFMKKTKQKNDKLPKIGFSNKIKIHYKKLIKNNKTYFLRRYTQ